MSDYQNSTSLANDDAAYAELTALFDQLRSHEPPLADDNFTKLVMNQLPRKPVYKTKQYARRGLSLDLMGVAAGIGVTLWYVSPTEMLAAVANALPESMVLSPMSLGLGFAAVCAASLLAWFGTENSTI